MPRAGILLPTVPCCIGIVGSEGAKFTNDTETKARYVIRVLLGCATRIVSGECHLGGIDIWAKEEALQACVPFTGYKPKHLSWSGGYKERNLLIAADCDLCVCITVASLPEGYAGMTFERCYHCGTDSHVKSGGCWTVKQAIRMGKEGRVVVV